VNDIVTLNGEQQEEIHAAVAAISAELKRLVESGPGHERTAMAIGTNLATIHGTLSEAQAGATNR